MLLLSLLLLVSVTVCCVCLLYKARQNRVLVDAYLDEVETLTFETVPFVDSPAVCQIFLGKFTKRIVMYIHIGELTVICGNKTQIRATVKDSLLSYTSFLHDKDYAICVGESSNHTPKKRFQVELWDDKIFVHAEELVDVVRHGPLVTGYRPNGAFTCVAHGKGLKLKLTV